MNERSALLWAWRLSLGFFVLAGLTGSLYRFILANGWDTGLELTNVRHAHSHVMYFGWVTPALFAMIGRNVLRRTGQRLPVSLVWILIGCFVFALSAHPLFLFFGYQSVAIGSAQMPIAVISSTMNMVAWYGFVVFYVRRTRGLERDIALQLWDIALTFLVLATLGAGGLAFLKPLGIESEAIASALTHVFLDFFSEGWFVLAVLGLAASELKPAPPVRKWPIVMLCAGLPMTFALGMPSLLVPFSLKVMAGIGGILVGVGLLALTVDLGRRLPPVWMLPLGLLVLKALGQIVVSASPTIDWSSLFGLRVLYLHIMLLGFVSLGLTAAAGHTWGEGSVQGRPLFYGGVVAVLISLVALTPIWPTAWPVYRIAAWVSLLPVVAVVWMLAASLRRPAAVGR